MPRVCVVCGVHHEWFSGCGGCRGISRWVAVCVCVVASVCLRLSLCVVACVCVSACVLVHARARVVCWPGEGCRALLCVL